MMNNILTAITWAFPKKEYLAKFANDDSAKNAAAKLWRSIDQCDVCLVVVMAVMTLLVCWFYFFPYNQKPGRHYKPKYWRIFWIVNFVLVLVVSYFMSYAMAKNPSFDRGLLFQVSWVNALYSLVLYWCISWGFNASGKSNAYKTLY